MISTVLFFIVLSEGGNSPLTDELREFFHKETNHDRRLFFSNDYAYKTVDNFQFGAVPFPAKGDIQVFDETKLDYDTYEDALVMEYYWVFFVMIGIALISAIWYLFRPWIGGTRGTQGLCCPKPFKKEKQQGYSFFLIRRCQIASHILTIILFIIVFIVFSYDAQITTHLKLITSSSRTIERKMERHLRLINVTYSELNITEYDDQYNKLLKYMTSIKEDTTNNVEKIGDYARDYNRARHGLSLFGLYTCVIMLALYIYSAFSLHYQMASGIAIFGWAISLSLLFASQITTPVSTVIGDSCLVMDKILNSDNFESLSVVNDLFPINDPSIMKMKTLFSETLKSELYKSLTLKYKQFCNDGITVCENMTESINDDNYEQYRDLPFNDNDVLYSSDVCQEVCKTVNQRQDAKIYTDYYWQIDQINHLVDSTFNPLLTGKPLSDFFYNLMNFLCTKSVFNVSRMSGLSLFILGILIFIFSIISMIIAKRFNLRYKAKPTKDELVIRGNLRAWELPDFNGPEV